MDYRFMDLSLDFFVFILGLRDVFDLPGFLGLTFFNPEIFQGLFGIFFLWSFEVFLRFESFLGIL